MNIDSLAPLQHEYPFDPSYGLTVADLLEVGPPPEPEGFADTWRERYRDARGIDPRPRLSASSNRRPGFQVLDLAYTSTDSFPIRGWLLLPRSGAPRRAFICGHGYAGIECPDFELPYNDAVYLIPCFRGLARSARPPISTDPAWHVIHDLDKPDRYILRGCVEDLWTGVTVLLRLYPWLEGRVGYMGISFGGGIGALALPWEPRIARAHLNVPSFGHQPMRLDLPTVGSAAAVQAFARTHLHTAVTLSGYDAAIAARHIEQPMHCALALFDPMVAPPGQFAIYNAIAGKKDLFLLRAGHFDYPEQAEEQRRLLVELRDFFAPLAD